MVRAAPGHSLLKNGIIIDGSGSGPYKPDSRVRSGGILDMGNKLEIDGDVIVNDCCDCYVTPGSIDRKTDYAGAQFWDGTCDLMHGVPLC